MITFQRDTIETFVIVFVTFQRDTIETFVIVFVEPTTMGIVSIFLPDGACDDGLGHGSFGIVVHLRMSNPLITHG